MKKTINILVIVLMIFTFLSCLDNEIREVKCYKFEFVDEYYWFPLNMGDSVVFTNTADEKKVFTVIDKSIFHTTSYMTYSGCGCTDISGMLLANEKDSIWLTSNLIYSESISRRTENLGFVIDSVRSYFYDSDRYLISSYSIDSIEFEYVKKFESYYSYGSMVKTVHMVKDLGIIRFETSNGIVWTNENLAETGTVELDSFNYTEADCE